MTMDAFKDLEAKGHGIPATVVGEKGRLSPAAPKPAQEATEAPRGQQTGIFAFYGEIRSSVLGLTPEMLAQSPFGEAIGDNTTDNLVDALRSATAVEVGQFVVGLLSVNAEKFAYAFEQAHYDGFKDALGMLVQRFRLMDGSEQTDLFTKIVLMFKDLMITKYADLGTDAAETVAAKFAAMMIDFLKSEAIQAADLSTDHTGKYY